MPQINEQVERRLADNSSTVSLTLVHEKFSDSV